ncbi:MAG: fused MFS/spermidine synthase [Flavobacteriales bacterium]|jgi:predicted membrane-bound spermidine synthase|nr:fused MFS/spermidine synthase [Flavobacteriales bacterium]
MNLKRKSKYPTSFWYLISISIIEGGAVMAVELLGAKLIAPSYGASLYVWATTLAVTMGGLTTGYLLGGVISEKYPHKLILHYIILASAIFVTIMPFTSSMIMSATLGMNLKVGIVISSLCFVFPPLVCFGMVSPLIIRLISREVKEVGNSVGTIYSISTLGGIVTTFLFGFLFIPQLGLTFSTYTTALALYIFPVYYFVRFRTFTFSQLEEKL